MEDLIKTSHLNEQEVQALRDEFTVGYCSAKGWNKHALTQEQSIEIMNTREWKNPGIMKS